MNKDNANAFFFFKCLDTLMANLFHGNIFSLSLD